VDGIEFENLMILMVLSLFANYKKFMSLAYKKSFRNNYTNLCIIVFKRLRHFSIAVSAQNVDPIQVLAIKHLIYSKAFY
jgi:hypothetical protein